MESYLRLPPLVCFRVFFCFTIGSALTSFGRFFLPGLNFPSSWFRSCATCSYGSKPWHSRLLALHFSFLFFWVRGYCCCMIFLSPVWCRSLRHRKRCSPFFSGLSCFNSLSPEALSRLQGEAVHSGFPPPPHSALFPSAVQFIRGGSVSGSFFPLFELQPGRWILSAPCFPRAVPVSCVLASCRLSYQCERVLFLSFLCPTLLFFRAQIIFPTLTMSGPVHNSIGFYKYIGVSVTLPRLGFSPHYIFHFLVFSNRKRAKP